MSSRFSLQAPYPLASLPRPIDHSNGQYVVGDVFGGAPGSKKRKRSELVVGVDGEGVNIYDISTSRLITSYALPPQTSFTCAPASLRTKISKAKIERRTYVSTTGSQAQITLFAEIVEGLSHDVSTITQKLGDSKSPIKFMGTVTASRASTSTEDSSDLLIVKEDGEVICFDGETLQERWSSPGTALYQDVTASTPEFIVEFSHLTNAHAASQGILKGRQDVFSLFPQDISEDGFNPDILSIITRSSNSRTLHLVTLPRRSAKHSHGTKHSIESLLAVNLPSSKNFSTKASFSLQVSTGVLTQLSKGRLTTFDLSNTLPKEIAQIRSPGAHSFLRLSSTSIIVSSNNSLHLYNPKFQSLLASTQVDSTRNDDTLKRKRMDTEETNGPSTHTCCLVSYFPKLGTAVGILNNELVGIQIESQGRGRAAGLLIDSLGCAIPGQTRSGQAENKKETGLSTMQSYLPSSFGERDEAWDDTVKLLEEAFIHGNTDEFDSMLAGKIGSRPEETAIDKQLVNGSSPSRPQLPQSSTDIDRRWIMYALGKIFTWTRKDDTNEYRLSILFYPHNTIAWLLRTGNITVSNIEAALRQEIRSSPFDALPSGELVNALVEADQELDLLHTLLANNFLGAAELLSAIRHLMESLGLLGDESQAMQKLLTDADDSGLMNGDVDEQVKELEAQVEEELEMAEYQLGPGSGVRGEALSLALSKLYTCPTSSIVYALQTTFSIQDVVALIYLLRYELARGAWTTRYLDIEQSDIIDEDADIPDNSIVLISSLLNNCVDAVGAGGWLSGEARLISGDPFEAEELISSLKLEISAALEGIEEVVYLRGLTSEMIRYGGAVQGGVQAPDPNLAGGKKRKTKPVLIPSTEQDMKTLPLGLKADQQISLLKVGAGGEIHERTRRDIGHLKSQKVGKYSLERIII
ncbi:Uncharacterized protein D0Z07_4721 [Hyphodiscus hymeniophilus]|uniref:Utp8 beta-propeller domain-containing protein n=1 Tax=Hyphodiscus hymeniophilus TaxID=353542 RepID=A0A9P6VJG3_9HELO|nr:Uncharacterized protein D0Z07_4721 [Hyphodiscus hymeniophilus]